MPTLNLENHYAITHFKKETLEWWNDQSIATHTLHHMSTLLNLLLSARCQSSEQIPKATGDSLILQGSVLCDIVDSKLHEQPVDLTEGSKQRRRLQQQQRKPE